MTAATLTSSEYITHLTTALQLVAAGRRSSAPAAPPRCLLGDLLIQSHPDQLTGPLSHHVDKIMEIENRGRIVVDARNAPGAEMLGPSMYLWRGDITQLKVGAVGVCPSP
jgi:hypothetical protein